MRLLLLVTALHLLLLLPLMKSQKSKTIEIHKPIAVRTVTPPPPPPKPKPAPKVVAKAKTKPKVKPKPKAKATAKREKLRQVQETIAKFQETADKLPQSRPLEKPAETLQIDRVQKRLNGAEQRYCDELAKRLRLLLRLPEFGEVKLVLTIDRKGSVCGVEVVRSLSSKNREYVVKTLSCAKLPGFGSLFADREQETFPITLTSEM